jgi:hypothetical protein
MTARKKTPYYELPSFVQYSKKICTSVTIFWMAYRIINFIMILIRPDVSTVLVDLVAGVDTTMICNMGFYIGKSGFENVAKIMAGSRALKNLKDDDDEDTDEKEDNNDEDQLEG